MGGAVNFQQFGAISKNLARRLLTIGENRLELLTLELREERERLLCSILMALGVAVLGLLAGMTLTAAIAVLLWPTSPFAVLLTMAVLYSVSGVLVHRRLVRQLHEWSVLSSSMDQLRKDRNVLMTILS